MQLCMCETKQKSGKPLLNNLYNSNFNKAYMNDFNQALPKQTEDVLLSELPHSPVSCALYSV